MERTIENLRQVVRAGRALIPADTLILHGNLVNVMTSEIYPADIAIYQDMIVAVGDVSAYRGPNTKVIDARAAIWCPDSSMGTSTASAAN
jgi:adenine deaminase